MKPTLLCFLAIIAASALPVGATTPPTEITVSGTGSVALPPNVATVSAAIETNAASATGAVSHNNDIYNRVVGALLKLGFARGDISLAYYNVSYNPPPQAAPPNPGERYGYTVSRGFTVKVREIARAGSVVDTCASSGATAINGVSFGIDDPSAARTRATDKAVADARAQAQTVARAAGLRIIAIKSIDLAEGGGGPQPMMLQAKSIASPTQFDQSNVSVTVSVSITFTAQP